MYFAAIFCICILCFLSRWQAIWRGRQYSIMRKQQIIFTRCIFWVNQYMFIFTLLMLFMVLRQLAIMLSDGGLVQDWTGGDSDSNFGLMSNFDRRLKCPSWTIWAQIVCQWRTDRSTKVNKEALCADQVDEGLVAEAIEAQVKTKNQS